MELRIQVLRGKSVEREVLLGFSPAATLHKLSFADVLDEASGTGYQRRFSEQHSLDFRRYIRRTGSTTIPLTFNLRPESAKHWRIVETRERRAELVVAADAGKILSQVDCQHRIGHVSDLSIVLPFMIFIKLSRREEMEVFNVINGKAKGLSSSLLDYHDARLAGDLGRERPELLIALHLNDCESSPWYKQLDLGGNPTSGLKRRASLRTMQKAVRRYLAASGALSHRSSLECAGVVRDYWAAVATVLREQWIQPRQHFLTKGVGVYALMGLLADLHKDALATHRDLTTEFFRTQLSDFAVDFDWTTRGPLKGLGGESGAQEALQLLRRARERGSVHHLEIVNG